MGGRELLAFFLRSNHPLQSPTSVLVVSGDREHMNFDDFNDPDFDMGGPVPQMSGVEDRPISQMFAEPLHVDDGQDAGDFGGGFDSNFDSDFGGFDGGFSGVSNDFGAMSSASLPALNTIPNMGESVGGSHDSFSGSGFGAHAPPPPSSQAPVFVGGGAGFASGRMSKACLCGCGLLYVFLVILLIVLLALCAFMIVLLKDVEYDINHLKLVLSVPTNAAPASLPPQIAGPAY